MSTGTDIARRNGASPAAPAAALALRPGQSFWDDKQLAALAQLGIQGASKADQAVFLHYCQRTQLDPFARQIYMIGRRVKDSDGKWVSKWTIQVGIDGFRVIRDRIARRDGVTVEYADTLWYDESGGEHEVWLWDQPPAACKVTVAVDGRRFPGVVRFNAYAQRNKDGELISQWKTQPDHMIEKCAEAFALRRAFPNDLAGIALDDEQAPSTDTVHMAPATRGRVTAAEIRQRAEPVAGEIVDAEVVAPGPQQRRSRPRQASAKDEHSPQQAVVMHFGRLGITDRDERLVLTGQLAGREIATTNDLDDTEAAAVADRLAQCRDIGQVHALISHGDAPGGSDG